MDKIVIVGVNEFAEYLFYTILKENQVEVVGFATLKDFLTVNQFCNLPVYPLEDLANILNSHDLKVLITIGYTKMNARREKTYNLCKSLGYDIYTYISSRAVCDSDLIGEGCIVMPMSYIPPLTKLGVCNVINVATIIGHTSVIGNFNWFSGNVTMGGNVTVHNNCFIGMNCLLKNGIRVNSQTMIGAYSYLSDDTIEGRFYSGNPAVNTKKLKSEVVCDFI